MKKILSKKGESILETLVALMIITFSFVFLTQAIITSNRVNKTVKEQNVGFTFFNISDTGSVDTSNLDDKGSISFETYSYNASRSESAGVDVFNETPDLPNTYITSNPNLNLFSVRNYTTDDTRIKYYMILEPKKTN